MVDTASRPTFEDFKNKALADPETSAAYDTLAPVYELKQKRIGMRKTAGYNVKIDFVHD
ncbi:hypothetical protein DESC_150007 [Desulfosarcina cetonica]|uniref:hypothetical protein n=1 Tax=Desulfosarcina cetonica TaxID=90730 RepID=UPI0012ECC593|nr:hypothetical protein [Desulfosarcina cetonica]VTR64193.1 hypothetical protein DESC_150007 [Desulfosarcina cetonica]